MIRLTNSLDKISEPFMGSEIISLYKSFYKQTNRLGLYENDKGAVLLRFDKRLLVSGKADFSELKSLCGILGVDKIEAMEGSVKYCRAKKEYHSIMSYKATSEGAETPEKAFDMKIPYRILSESDSHFKDVSLYDYWLSDIRSMERTESFTCYIKEDKATASVASRGCGFSLISQVATLPAARGMGLASQLLTEICFSEQNMGQIPFLISKNEETDLFYHKLGFTYEGKKVLIYL